MNKYPISQKLDHTFAKLWDKFFDYCKLLGLNYLWSCSVLISENEQSIQRVECKDKISAKKCKKLKKKGKCEDKKSWKKCMETCQKCTPGTSDCNWLFSIIW